MKNLKFNQTLDKVGITASVLCAIHCAFFPVLLTLLPLLGIGFLVKGWAEIAMVLFSLLIAGVSILSAYKLHQNVLPLVLLATGFSIIGVVHLFLPKNLEPFILPFGGLSIAFAHYLNLNYKGRCFVKHHYKTQIVNRTK
ncbi:MerC domain-containing protein [uncultured Mucilaginibacter sp.]|uniref:MerC domain-containing protein n=1 Tax=uncultured Mucilaginibacter sp. TaxID=797541 RepID=UPI00262FCC2E|nr:MerC domain-containing protein [uncultured Mucilaginibacter sp.]